MSATGKAAEARAAQAGMGDAGLVHTTDDPRGLAAIAQGRVALVVWQRSMPVDFMTWLERLPAAMLPENRLLVRPRHFVRAANALLDRCGMPKAPHRKALVDDMHALVLAYGEITGATRVDVRIERVVDDACWKFHRDCVEMRLLTTYRGPATEWVLPAHAAAALHDQTQYEGPLQRLDAGHVAVFKGRCAAGSEGIVHRSPPILGTGKTRLLLCLNTPSETSPLPWDDRLPETA